MKKRRLILAFVLSTFLSLFVGFLSNLASTYIAPSLQNKPWIVYFALAITFIFALPVSIYLFLRSLPDEPDRQLKDILNDKEQVSNSIPEKTYKELVGRDSLIGEVMGALRDPSWKWLISIDGIGGIGKTALVREVADHCLKERLFNAIVWVQAPREQKGTEGIGSMTYESILNAIAYQTGFVDIPQMKIPEKEHRIKVLMKSRRLLIILDNMESAKENQDDIAKRLLPLLNPCKVLMTSRHRFDGTVYAFHLAGLDIDSALKLIRLDSNQKNISNVLSASNKELKKIVSCTGGSPLAIKLVVGQLAFLPLDVVLKQLQNVKVPQGYDDSDYVLFYKGIFMPSWNLLSEESKKLLVIMAKFVSDIGGTYDAIQKISKISEDSLPGNIDELWRLSFLEISGSDSLIKIRYSLHALTQYFVLSDIVKRV